jgi:predicted helicase
LKTTLLPSNPVSKAMQKMLDTLEDQALEKETQSLEKFYASVRERASGIDNAEGRQRVVIELYDKFFRAAFPKMAERLGIVYTPVEVVDFIVHSLNDVLKQEFDSSLGKKDVHIIDPFTGTGTFMVRLLQSGLIAPKELPRKYKEELHANELVLLAYYIAAINIEETFHSLSHASQSEDTPQYIPFDGIVLTDTFQLAESKNWLEEKMFPENNRRVKRQKDSPIRVVMGNPPYSAQQDNANDNNKNLVYPTLDSRIRTTYATASNAGNVKNLYDSYIRALRWASDRIDGRGIVGFVTNGSFIDGNNMDGLRACLTEEFSTIYVFNLRGNARTSGEQRRMEKGNVFGEGTRTPVAISLFVKNPGHKGQCQLFYKDIGDYLSREEKLDIIRKFKSIEGIRAAQGWQALHPNDSHDWINARDPKFDTFISLGDKKDDKTKTLFVNYSLGVGTNRDAWAYNFSKRALSKNMTLTIDFYNQQVEGFKKILSELPSMGAAERLKLVENYIDNDTKKISWSSSLIPNLGRGVKAEFSASKITVSLYRPFSKQCFFYDGLMNHRIGQMPSIFPMPETKNLVICVTGVGAAKDFSALMTDCIPNLHTHDTGQCFPLYLYEKDESKAHDLLGNTQEGELIDGYRRRSAITPEILAEYRAAYEKKITAEDIFYYVYGLLHSPEYKARFASDLKKMLPRIPFTKKTEDFWTFSKAGRNLAEWHLDYETITPQPLTELRSGLDLGGDDSFFTVEKMTFGRKDKQIDKSTIVYNSHLTLTDIPLEACEYIVNGKPALEWIMERYQVTVDKDSGIKNDPNDWAREHKQPRYIVDLIKRVVKVSLETMKIVQTLPPLNERMPSPTNSR